MKDLSGITLKKQYFLRNLAGRGGMAEVYLAWDNLRSTKMAVKILRRDLASNYHFYQAFEKEAASLSELQHPNIVRLYEFGKEGDIAFIVMAWVDGGNLRQRLDAIGRPFSLAEVSRILQPVCSALNFAHKMRAYHCDIKPSNIMLHENGKDVFLADFGVARRTSERGGGGTPPYMAPEQFFQKVSAQTDIYSLGITVYELLSGGELPFHGDSKSPGSTTRERYAWEHKNLSLPPLNQYNRSLSQTIVDVVGKAMHKEPGQRFASVMAFWDAFNRACAVYSSQESQPTASEMSPPVMPPSISSPPSIPSPRGGSKFHLLARSGELAGQFIPLLGIEIKIGRGSGCHVRLQERSVSRNHATILITKRGVYLRDDNSAFGTYLNGKRIPSDVPMPLHQGDVIQTGYYQFFEFQSQS